MDEIELAGRGGGKTLDAEEQLVVEPFAVLVKRNEPRVEIRDVSGRVWVIREADPIEGDLKEFVYAATNEYEDDCVSFKQTDRVGNTHTVHLYVDKIVHVIVHGIDD